MTQIVVLGDIIRDKYIQLRKVRQSPEADCPIVIREKEFQMAGGAAAVAAMCWHLGCHDVHLGGVIGDIGAEGFWSTLYRAGVFVRHVQFAPMVRLTTKTRHLVDGKQVYREDSEDPWSAPDEVIEDVLKGMPDEPNAILVADYGKGFVTPYLMHRLREKWPYTPVIADPARGKPFEFYKECNAIVPNRHEVEWYLNKPPASASIVTAHYIRKALFDAVIFKVDKEGLILACDEVCREIPATANTVVDVCGAGDQVLAALGVFLAEGFSWEESAILANDAAGVKCGKLGVTPAHRSEIAARIKEFSHAHCA